MFCYQSRSNKMLCAGKRPFDVANATSAITLHSKELNIKSATFTASDGTAQDVATISYNMKETYVELKFGSDFLRSRHLGGRRQSGRRLSHRPGMYC